MAARPAVRSWLAKAKSIHDLGGHFYVSNSSKPWDEKRDMLSERKRQAMYRKPLPVAAEYERFFGSSMHDSWPIEVERTSGVFRLTLNSIDGNTFIRTLGYLLDIEIPEVEMPVDLLLHNPIYVRAARYGIHGELRFEEWESLGKPGSEHVSGFQFLSDWFHEQDGRVQWIAEIWGGQHWHGKMSSSLYLMVDATHATAVDRRRLAMERVLGPMAGLLWQEALETEGVYFGDVEDFLVRRLRGRGLTATDFKP